MRKCFIFAKLFNFVVLEIGLLDCFCCRQWNYLLSTIDLLLIAKNFSF